VSDFTLSADAAWSSIKESISNGDEIDLSGFQLTIDEEPTHTGIDVVSPGTAGTVVIDGAYDMSTWSFTGGTAAALMASVPTGCSIDALTGGEGTSDVGATNIYGHVEMLSGGSGTYCYGSNAIRAGATIGTCVGGPSGSNYSYGCVNNYGYIALAQGGDGTGSRAIYSNYGYVALGEGSDTSPGSYAISSNFCHVSLARGGASSQAISINYGQVHQSEDGVQRAIGYVGAVHMLVDGPNFAGSFLLVTGVTWSPTLYVLNGPLHVDADIPEEVEIVELFGSVVIVEDSGHWEN